MLLSLVAVDVSTVAGIADVAGDTIVAGFAVLAGDVVAGTALLLYLPQQ